MFPDKAETFSLFLHAAAAATYCRGEAVLI
jgi:hypothetical protein